MIKIKEEKLEKLLNLVKTQGEKITKLEAEPKTDSSSIETKIDDVLKTFNIVLDKKDTEIKEKDTQLENLTKDDEQSTNRFLSEIKEALKK